MNFEECLKELEKVVSLLESKDIPLEEACNAYKKGLELSKECYEIFKQTEDLIVKQVSDKGIEEFNRE